MPRPEKVQAVADIKGRIEEAHAVFLAEYAGLSVKEQQVLRRELRASEAEFKVVKMTLARLAVSELDIEDLDELLLGPTGLAFADGDPAGAAKTLSDFAKAHEVFAVKGGLLGREFLTPERVAQLAALEPRDVLLAKLAGGLQAPLAKAAGLMAALPRGLANAVHQLLEIKEQEQPVEAASPDGEAMAAEAEPAAGDEDDSVAGQADASTADDAGESAAEAADGDPEPESTDVTDTEPAAEIAAGADEAAETAEEE